MLEDRNSKYSPNAAWMRSLRRDYFLNMIKKEGYAAAIRKVRNELKLNAKLYPFAAISVFIDLIIENSNQSSHYLGKKSNNVIFVIISLWQSRFLLLINIFSFLIALFFSVRNRAFQKKIFCFKYVYFYFFYLYI